MSEPDNEQSARDPSAKPVLEWTPEEWQAWIETTHVPRGDATGGATPAEAEAEPEAARGDDWWDRLAGDEAPASAVLERPGEPPAPPMPPSPPLEPPQPLEPPPPPVEPPPPPVEPPRPVEPPAPPVTPPVPPVSHRRTETTKPRRPIDPRPHRARSGLALLAVSVTVGVVTAFLVAVSITVAVLALKRAVG